jgi:hypothetical protein
MSVTQATWEAEVGGSWSEASLSKKLVRPNLKNNPNFKTRTGSMSQVIEYFPSKHEALSSSPNTSKTSLFKLILTSISGVFIVFH